MRVAFMGTPEFALPTLKALIAAGHDVIGVYSQPPAPAGRGKKLKPSPVHAFAEAEVLKVFTPKSMRDSDAQAEFASLNADVAVVVAFGQILPQVVLDTPKYGCVNVHASLLPRWRGAAPIHRAIMAGDAETGVCIMQMEAGLDTGPVLLRQATPIAPEDTTGSLHDRLSAMGAALIVEALARLDELEPEPQPGDGVTYADKIDKSEARVDWAAPAVEVDGKIRGLSPFPGAWIEVEGQRIKLLGSRVAEGRGAPGEVLDEALTVACGEGAVQVLRLQRAGRGPQDAEEFLRGTKLPRGTRL